MKKNSKINIIFSVFVSLIVIIPFIGRADVPGVTPAVKAVVSDYKATADDVATVRNVYNDIQKEEGKYKFMVPLGPFASIVSDTTDLTTGDALVKYLRTWFKFLIGIAGVIAVAKLVYLGFQIILSSSNIDAKSKIKSELTSTVTAFLLVALSWVFLNTLNPALVNESVLLPNLETKVNSAKEAVYKVENSDTPDAEIRTGMNNGDGWYFVIKNAKGIKQGFGPKPSEPECLKDVERYKSGELKFSSGHSISDGKCYPSYGALNEKAEADVRARLAKSGIYANKDGCKLETDTSCTRLQGLSLVVLSKLELFTSNCCKSQITTCTKELAYKKDFENCPVVITGGTEFGHASHGRGLLVYDIRYNNELDNFLKTNSTVIAGSFSGNKGAYTKYLYDGNWYTDEVDAPGGHHFHVCLNNPKVKGGACGTYDPNTCKNVIRLSNGQMQIKCK